MAIFAVIPTSKENQVADSIQTKVAAGKFMKLPRGEWLISYKGTSQQLSDQLGISTGVGGNAVIVAVSGYYGNAPVSVWEWIQQHWSADA